MAASPPPRWSNNWREPVRNIMRVLDFWPTPNILDWIVSSAWAAVRNTRTPNGAVVLPDASPHWFSAELVQ